MLRQGEGQLELFAHQALMQVFDLFFRRRRFTADGQPRPFHFDIQFALPETGQRQRNAVVIVIAFLDVVRWEPLGFLATH